MKILYIDAGPRSSSRTRRLADALISHLEGDADYLRLIDADLPRTDEAAINRRYIDAKNNDFSAPVYELAKQFASADVIVIAAPFWDMSFPAVLKQYIEAVTVAGITFRYTSEGIPKGLCKAKELYYITTAGGPVFNEEYGCGYIRMMSQGMYGIPGFHSFRAENLDIAGADVEGILRQAEDEIAEAVGGID